MVYNTSGYERVEILKLLDGIVDIYLPDMKFMHPDQAKRYLAGATDYPEITKRAVLEMHRQVGVLRTDREGIAQRGLVIRHLVMPNRVAGTKEFVDWVVASLEKQARGIRSDVPIILCTGYREPSRKKLSKPGEIGQVMIKSVTSKDLALTIRNRLAVKTGPCLHPP